MAFEFVKAMQADGLEWGEGYRPLGRQALEEIIEGQMAAAVDRYLEQLEADDAADRRNGSYRRHLLTELGDIELNVPRTRRYSPTEVIRAYARRTPEIDRVILAGFVLGLSTRKVGKTLLALLGRPVSAATVSQVAKTLDAAVAAFHRRPLANHYKVLMLDGVVLARRTGAGALRRPVLVALGLRHDGKKEIIDFRLAESESAAEWERFLTDLYRRGLTGEGLDMVCVDGGKGLLAALPTVLPGIAVQRCWAHKIRNIAQQGPQGRPAGRQARPAQDHERRRRSLRPLRRAGLRRPLRPNPSRRRRLPAQRPRRSPHLLPLQVRGQPPRRAHHQRHRAPFPRSQAAHQTHGHFPGQNHPWIASCSPSSLTKTSHRASVPLSC